MEASVGAAAPPPAALPAPGAPLTGKPAGARPGPQQPFERDTAAPASPAGAAPPAAALPPARSAAPPAAPTAPPTTLPAVKDFLQKAFETVQRSQMEILAQSSLQRALAAHAQYSFHRALAAQPRPPIVSPFPFARPVGVAPEPPRSIAASEPPPGARPAASPAEGGSVRPERPAGPTQGVGLLGPAPPVRPAFPSYAMYNRPWAPPLRPRVPLTTRPVLVPTRQNPAEPVVPVFPKAGSAEEAPGSLSSSASESSSSGRPEADSGPAEKSGTGSRPAGKLEADSDPSRKPEAGPKPPGKPSSDTKPSERPRPARWSDKTPKNEVNCTSRVAQTYQAYKASQKKRATNASKQSLPTSKKGNVPKPLGETSKKNNAPKSSGETSKKADAPKSSVEAPQNNDAPKPPAESSTKGDAPQSSTQSPKKGGASQSPKKGSAPQSPKKGAPGGRRPRDPPKDLNDDVDPKRRVLVSGFPPYTQPPDLARVLARFGTCVVERCRNRLAVVTFSAEPEARAALAAPDDLCIYGDFVDIKPFTSPAHVDELFRAYKKIISIDKGQDIIMPNKIDLSGDFYQQLDNIEKAIRLTREQVQAVASLYVDLERVLQEEWPGCVAIPFGSIPTGLGITSSDADCYVELPAALRTRGGAGAFVTRARRLLAQYPRVFTQLVAIPRANTPIVKFRHAPSGFHCDVSSKTPLGAQNTRLIKLLLEHDARLPRVAVLLKYWAKVHGLSGTGRLTNYALTMMVLFYLQQPRVALVPAVERLQREPAHRYLVDHWDAGFAPRRLPGPPNAASLPDLLGGFFEFYAAFDFDKLVVCPYLGVPLPKSAFAEPDALPPELARYAANVRDNLAGAIRHATPFCVQDPFEQSHNVASSVSARLAADIRAYVALAAAAYAAERAAGCPTLLRTLLLARPRLRRAAPSTKLVLIPRVRGDLPAAGWRARVRHVLLDLIFLGIMRLRLTRDPRRDEAADDERRERAGVDREQYAGAATKPVWRRKRNFSSNAPEAAATLVARQAAVTDDIVRSAPDTPLRFEFELGYRDEPRQLYVCARLVDGEVDCFRQFVVFLHTAMFDWFKILLRPYQTGLEPEADSAADLCLAALSLAGDAEGDDEPEEDGGEPAAFPGGDAEDDEEPGVNGEDAEGDKEPAAASPKRDAKGGEEPAAAFPEKDAKDGQEPTAASPKRVAKGDEEPGVNGEGAEADKEPAAASLEKELKGDNEPAAASPERDAKGGDERAPADARCDETEN